MYIGRIGLNGFKSFGGVHELPLEMGMVAIVGPNGSGKSNILDALKWTLGGGIPVAASHKPAERPALPGIRVPAPRQGGGGVGAV